MNNSAIQKLLMSVSVLGLSGCAYQYEPESRFGLTVREAITQQSIVPRGVGHDRIDVGFEGAAAAAVMDRYIRSYEQPAALGDVFRIGVGGVSTDSPANASRSSDRR